MLIEFKEVGGWRACLYSNALELELENPENRFRVSIEVEKFDDEKRLAMERTSLRVNLENVIENEPLMKVRRYLCENYLVELPSSDEIGAAFYQLSKRRK